MEALRSWQTQTRKPGECRVIVDRVTAATKEDMMLSMLNNVRRPNFSFLKAPYVEFLFEQAVDSGGPRRELLRYKIWCQILTAILCNFTLTKVSMLYSLVMTYLVESSGIFDRIGDSVTFSYNVHLLGLGRYREAGKLIGWSLLHEGPGFHSLAIEVAEMLLGEMPDLRSWESNIIEDRYKDAIMKVYQMQRAFLICHKIRALI